MNAPRNTSPEGSQHSHSQDERVHQERDGSGDISQSQGLLTQRLIEETEYGRVSGLGNDDSVVDYDLQQQQMAGTSRLRTASMLSYDSFENPPPDFIEPLPAPPDKTTKLRRWCCLPTSIWTSEILSCAIAAACMAAIIGILLMHQGLPLPQWPLHITINALVSVFTAIFKMALTMPIADGKPKASDLTSKTTILTYHRRHQPVQVAVVQPSPKACRYRTVRQSQ